MAARAHFSTRLFTFLRELSSNNDRDWFNANKARYESDVKGPALQFIVDFTPRLQKISRHFIADPRPVGGSLMRVYRDTRFAKDKTPYKTNVGIQFRHDVGKDVHAPGFYLHLAQEDVFVGIGMWHPEPSALSSVRGAIAEKPEAWTKATAHKPFKAHFQLEGDSLARPPQGFDAAHPLITDLKRKDFIAVRHFTQRDACAPAFIDEVAGSFDAGRPFMTFLAGAMGLPF